MPSHVRGGISDTAPGQLMFDYAHWSPLRYHTYFNDFNAYVAGDWTITETGTGTRALADAAFGVLLVTNAAADNDANFFQKKGESFKFVAGKKLWFETRFKVSDATQSDFVAGLQIIDTTPLAVTDGVYFRKDDGDADLDFVVIKDSAATTASAIATLVSDTWISLGFYYDGSAIKYYVNDALAGSSVVTNLVDDEELTISWGVQNGEAVAKTCSMDRLFASVER